MVELLDCLRLRFFTAISWVSTWIVFGSEGANLLACRVDERARERLFRERSFRDPQPPLVPPWFSRTVSSDEGLGHREPSCLSPVLPLTPMIPWKARCTMCWQCSEYRRCEWPRPGHTRFPSPDRLGKGHSHARLLFSSSDCRLELVKNAGRG